MLQGVAKHRWCALDPLLLYKTFRRPPSGDEVCRSDDKSGKLGLRGCSAKQLAERVKLLKHFPCQNANPGGTCAMLPGYPLFRRP